MAKQRIAIFGAGGLISSKLELYFSSKPDFDVMPFPRSALDLTQASAVKTVLDDVRPDWIINCAAFLNADRCEKEPDSSYKVNYKVVADLAEILGSRPSTKLIHFSSDFVFDGKTGGYDENAMPLPVSYYGLHKYMADNAIMRSGIPAYVLRIASVIGAGDGKRDLVKALLGRVADGAQKLSVIKEYEISTSTPKFMASVIEKMITAQPAFGIYNTVAAGVTSWLDVAATAFNELGVNVPFEAIPPSAYPTPAARPPKSWLKTDKLKAVMGTLPEWEEMIRDQVRDNRASYLSVLEKRAA